MNHLERVDLYKQYMTAQGVQMNAAAPPLWEMLWARGINLPPPPFLGAITLGLICAIGFALIPVLFWVISYFGPERRHLPWSVAAWLIAAMALAGLVGPPAYYHRMARRHGLARWSTFRGVRQRI